MAQIERGFFSLMLHEDHKSSQSAERKKSWVFLIIFGNSGWKGYSISQSAVLGSDGK
jgi:hypothetical protein